MRLIIFSVLCALACVTAASLGKRAGYSLKDKHEVPPKWKQLHRAQGDHTISLQIGLKQKSFEELERHLYEVSDPHHERYGQHLSKEQIHLLTAPEDDSLEQVHQWLNANGVELDDVEYNLAKDWITVVLSVSEIEGLLDTEYHVYENAAGDRVVRTAQYSLPVGLHDHIDLIQPTNYFGNPRAMSLPMRLTTLDSTPQDDYIPQDYPWNNPPSAIDADLNAVCNESAVTNLCLRTLYKTVDYVPQVPDQNTVGMTAYLNETANMTDFHLFMSTQRQDADANYYYNYTTINGGADDQNPVPPSKFGALDVEANLDSQTIGGFVYPTQFKIYSTGGKPPFKKDRFTPTDSNEPYLGWLQAILGEDDLPHTVSTSYGDDEQTVPFSYAKRVCQEMAQLGARGVTLLFSAGDDGVGANGTCVSNDGQKRRMFVPEFPTSCPYITSVGGTRNFEPEIIAWNGANGYVSGSGVSNYFARPSYQSAAVERYLTSIGGLHHGLYNKTGRAYPDIAAQGYHYVITYGGQNISVDGTSAASPCAASVLTLVNDALIAAGKSPLGFLNPLLYKSLYSGFNDVTIGSTWGCNTNGFPAKEGWDLASGWGTPNFLKIKELLLGTTDKDK